MNPVNNSVPRCHFNQNEQSLIQNEICKLLQMGVLKEVEHHPEEFLSPIFLVPKKDGEYRMILNLKNLIESITSF